VEHLKRHTLQVLSVLAGMLLVLSLAMAVVLNSGMLNHWAKEAGMALFNEKLMGRLELDHVELKFPNRVTVIQPRIYEEGEDKPVLMARKVSAKLNFLSLLQPAGLHSIHFSGLRADSLTVRAIQRQSGKLNLALVFSSRDPDSTKSGVEEFSLRAAGAAPERCVVYPIERKDSGG